MISLFISNKFKQNQMQNVDFVQFQQNGIISGWSYFGSTFFLSVDFSRF